jgi:glycosyltransferase involved in cell wall biosynthesis
MTLPTVSVVIPAYNVEAYLADGVESCLGQGYGGLKEVLIVDNGSTDGTLGLAQALARRDPGRVRVMQELRKGASAARNCGLNQAMGDWIQFLDADDYLLPGKLERQARMVAEHGGDGSGMVWGAFVRLSAQEARLKRLPTIPPFLALLRGDYDCGITSSNLWSREMTRAVGGFPENATSSQETTLIFRLLKACPRVLRDALPGAMVRVRTDGQQISDPRNESRKVVNFFELRKEILRYLGEGDRKGWMGDVGARRRLFWTLLPRLTGNAGDNREYRVAAVEALLQWLYRPGIVGRLPGARLRFEVLRWWGPCRYQLLKWRHGWRG